MPGPLVAVEGGLLPPDLLDQIVVGDVEGQDPAAFGLGPNRRLIDEIQRAFSDAHAEWNAFQMRLKRSRESRTTLTRQYWAAPFLEILGFESLRTQRAHVEAGGRRYDISHLADEAGSAPPVHIVAVGQGLDARDGRRSPHNSVQEYLNRSDGVWGMVTNGERLRLLRDSERFTRPTYVEFDLRGIFEGNQYSDFALVYRLMHRTRFPDGGADVAGSWLERYYHLGIDQGGRVRKRLRDGVEDALRALGQGLLVHPRSEALRGSLREGRLGASGYYRQLLRTVYRLLFLMVAEERRLIFPEGQGTGDDTVAYRRYYSVASLRDRCERYFDGDEHHDLWIGLTQTFRSFRSDEEARPLGLEPLDSELFDRSACADLEDAACSNETLLRAMLNLSTFVEDVDGGGSRRGRSRGGRGVRRRVNYAALDVEELGSVYESLLDLEPRIQFASREGGSPEFRLVASSERKQTGSYYTPPELVRELIGSALVPVLTERLEEGRTRAEREEALLGMRVLDPASGSGHFLLAAARRIAVELAQVRATNEGYSPAEYREALRDVIRHCIYAVDKNPLAVDLCKVALWIESHSPGLPLSFLDHHVKCGDSLVGVGDLGHLNEGIPDGAYRPIEGDDKAAATSYRKRNAAERGGQLVFGHTPAETAEWAEDFKTFAILEERNPDEVQAKEDLYAQLRNSDTRWGHAKAACDLWTYAFFAPLQPASPDGLDGVPTTNDVIDALAGYRTSTPLLHAATAAAETHGFFHWPLEFADVFERGGFDVVLGNPPWERIKLQEKEFFAGRDDDIADAPKKADRQRLIRQLAQHNPGLAREFAGAKHTADSQSRFVRGSTRFPLAGRGDVNTYSVFAETCRRVMHPTGRGGMIVPSGIATDDTTKILFADLVDSRSLVSLFDFENREGVFLGVHRSYKFCLLTLTGWERPSDEAEFGFFFHQAEQLNDPTRRFVLAPEDFALFNPNTRTCPVFRTRRDAEIATKMYRRAGVFWKEARDGGVESNPWGIRFLAMFHMSNDSGLFRTREQLACEGWRLEGNTFARGDTRYLPLYEAKLFHQYDHRFATFDGVSEADLRRGNAKEVAGTEKADPEFIVLPRYWVPEEEVARRLDRREDMGNDNWPASQPATRRPQRVGSRLALRKITQATNERTGIFAVISAVGVGDSGIIISVGTLSSETSPGQPTSEPQYSLLSQELR